MTYQNTTFTKIQYKIHSVIGLVTTTAPSAKVRVFENKIPATSHFTNTQEFNKLMTISFNVRMKEAAKDLLSKLK